MILVVVDTDGASALVRRRTPDGLRLATLGTKDRIEYAEHAGVQLLR